MVKTVKRAFNRFQGDNMLDHAAALTYYVMMSLFPALLVVVSLLGVLGNESLVTNAVQYAKDQGAPAEVTNALEKSLSSIVQNSGGAVSVALVFGIAIALYGASGAFGAAGRALNDVYGAEETRSFFKHKLSDLAWTLVVILLAIVSLFCVFLGGGLAKDLFGTIGLGETAAQIFSFARWLIAIGAVLLIYAIVFAFAPNIQPRRRQIITPGGIAGVLIWIVASFGFFFYVSNFGKYNATYGTFAGAVILLLWLYISNIAFLFGAELNAEVDAERGRLPAAGGSATSQAALSQGWRRDNGAGDGRVDEKYGRDALSQR
ncbi:MAG TPA: YihY/virulence factor BrkB family protein [Solirubrobacteraceae bacterium]|jgi:membrane protein